MKFSLHKFLNMFIATVWLINGLYAKILGLVPRHKQIVAEILPTENPKFFLLLIGICEILMALWILSGKYSRINVIPQAFIILLMNILEFTLAPELLLWGKWNFVFACCFVALILWNEFYLNKNAKT